MNCRFNANSVSASELFEALATEGYVIIEDALNGDTLDKLRSELEPWFQSGHEGHDDFMGHKTVRFGALLEKSHEVQKLITHPAVLALADQLLLPYCVNYHIHYTGVMQLKPGQPAQVLHRDTGVFPFANPSPPFTLATMWALDRFTRENGGTTVVPQSHRWGDEREPRKSELVHTEMSPGSVLLYSGNVIHGGGTNNSDADRTGLAIHYGLGWLRQEENQYLACSPDVARTLPGQLQRLLGYELGAPSLGFADHVHPRDHLQGVRDPADSVVSTDDMRERAANLKRLQVETIDPQRSRYYEPID
ncbi:MAG: phytanoyl-CoA dioxygenase family protein [Pseudomonadota bacterium]